MEHLASVRSLLLSARALALSFGSAETQEVRDERTTDISTLADRRLSSFLIDGVNERWPGSTILTEESGRLDGDGRITVAIDDLDGTDNFHRFRQLLPWCTVVTVFRGNKPSYRDALAAGIIEHHSGYMWLAEADECDGAAGTETGPDGREIPLRASLKKVLDRRSLVLVDHYTARKDVAGLSGIHESAWVKDFGSSALHLSLVASGRAEACVNLRHKAHELGAGYLLCKAAGAEMVTTDGQDLGTLPFVFDGTIPVIMAANTDMKSALMALLR